MCNDTNLQMNYDYMKKIKKKVLLRGRPFSFVIPHITYVVHR